MKYVFKDDNNGDYCKNCGEQKENKEEFIYVKRENYGKLAFCNNDCLLEWDETIEE